MSHNAQGECSQSGQAEDQSSAQGRSLAQGHLEADATPSQPAEATGQPGELAGLQDLEVPTAEMRDMFGMAWSGLEHYAQMLAEEGQLRGLIGPRELPRLYSRHLVNSAAGAPFLAKQENVAEIRSAVAVPRMEVGLSTSEQDMRPIAAKERPHALVERVG